MGSKTFSFLRCAGFGVCYYRARSLLGFGRRIRDYRREIVLFGDPLCGLWSICDVDLLTRKLATTSLVVLGMKQLCQPSTSALKRGLEVFLRFCPTSTLVECSSSPTFTGVPGLPPLAAAVVIF